MGMYPLRTNNRRMSILENNLKKFPYPVGYIAELSQSEFEALVTDMILWKEGFEKELRKILKTRNLCLDKGHDMVPDIVTEILGEM